MAPSLFFISQLLPFISLHGSCQVALQMLFGSQMGWFSLLGRDNMNPPMGILGQLLDPAYTPEVDYLRLLAESKLRVNAWLTHGRMMVRIPGQRMDGPVPIRKETENEKEKKGK